MIMMWIAAGFGIATSCLILFRTFERRTLLCARVYCVFLVAQTAFALAAFLRYILRHTSDIRAAGASTKSWVTQAFLSSCVHISMSLLAFFFMTYDLLVLNAPSNVMSGAQKQFVLATYLADTTFLVGAAIFCNIQPWTFSQAFVFCVTTFTTIGYGNLTPKTTISRIVFMIYALLGISVVGFFLTSVRNVMIHSSQESLRKRILALRELRERVQRKELGEGQSTNKCSFLGHILLAVKRWSEKEWDVEEEEQEIESMEEERRSFSASESASHHQPHGQQDNLDVERQKEAPSSALPPKSQDDAIMPRQARRTDSRNLRPESEQWVGMPTSSDTTLPPQEDPAVIAEDEAETDRKSTNRDDLESQAEQDLRRRAQRGAGFRVAVWAIVFWLAGALVFYALERDWTYFDAIYFTYVTLTTIGFGDYIPNSPGGWEFWTYYSLFQIAFVGIVLGTLSDLFEAGGARALQTEGKEESNQ
ncbi:hypothetical protein M427DRAFT_171706 [Gonapodya prolifera JEL478]|uniref:Potassium channel domain-containing protein n=1 Tax=Gonapodya prolifera (strain JEL478) TaxID=1344416 RepID=A0A139B094_GONPJ|nr:hypothetical protein M427DRAFT_171706 [Gonapodya prolifera JEL478]|eukprot:KXS22394.1 hypothetical protein M427DRAFT_171706 [Gonapodya prolifera JEL478]